MHFTRNSLAPLAVLKQKGALTCVASVDDDIAGVDADEHAAVDVAQTRDAGVEADGGERLRAALLQHRTNLDAARQGRHSRVEGWGGGVDIEISCVFKHLSIHSHYR